MVTIGIIIIFLLFFISFPAFESPYNWDTLQNCLYYGFSRIGYGVGVFLVLFPIFLNQFNLANRFLTNKYWRAAGKIAFECSLICPLVISVLYDRTMTGIYITVNEGVSFLAGNIMSNIFVAVILFLVIEYPA